MKKIYSKNTKKYLFLVREYQLKQFFITVNILYIYKIYKTEGLIISYDELF